MATAPAAFGATLLSEIEESSLHELLRDVQYEASNENAAAPVFNIPALDRIVNCIHQQQHHHQHAHAVQAPVVVELSGVSLCSGRTQLLYKCLAQCILPPTILLYGSKVTLHGKGQAAVLVNLSRRFSILRLVDVMKHHISHYMRTTGHKVAEAELESVVEESLCHLYMYHPRSTIDLAATLASIPDFLLADPPAHISTNRPLGLLAMNDLSAFYWQDRQDAEDETAAAMLSANTTTSSTTRAPGSGSLVHGRYADVVKELRKLHSLFGCAIVAINWAFAAPQSSRPQPSIRPHLPSSWNTFVTVRLLMQSDQVSQFAPRISLEEALREKEQRWAAVQKRGFSVWVNRFEAVDGTGGAGAGRVEALASLPNGGAFSFRVTSQGVMIDDVDDAEV